MESSETENIPKIASKIRHNIPAISLRNSVKKDGQKVLDSKLAAVVIGSIK